jgi:gas vesicle protein
MVGIIIGAVAGILVEPKRRREMKMMSKRP